MKQIVLAFWMIAAHFAVTLTAEADEATESAKPFLDELERLGPVEQFGPRDYSPKLQFSSLNSAGSDKLFAAWDYLFPESCNSPKSDAEIKRLVDGLREDDLERREAATRELTIVAQYDRRPLISGAKSEEIEVALRCKSILANVDKSQETRLSAYSTALSSFIRQMPGDRRLPILSSNTSLALQKGPVPTGHRGKILTACLERIVTEGKDSLCNELIPILQADELTAHFVTENIGSHRYPRFYPDLLLEALRSKHPSVVMEAISWTSNCWDEKKRPLVEKALKAHFAGEDKSLKFQVCFPLMHDYDDADAMKYLVEQAASMDRLRKINAVGWIGDSCNWNKPLTPEIRDVLVPLLDSTDKDVRRAAGDAIGTYSGVEVIDNLIGLLNDSEGIIIQEAIRNLKEKDKALVVQRLKVRIADFPMKARQRLEMLVQQLSDSNANLKEKSAK